MRHPDSDAAKEAFLQYHNETKEFPSEAYFKKAGRTSSPSRFLSEYQVYIEEHGIEHSPYSNEKKMMDAVSRGDYQSFEEASSTSLQFSFGQMTMDKEKEMEYQCVIGVSLYCRAAIEGGVDPLRAYNLNDLFLQRISRCSSNGEYIAVMMDAINTLFQEVHQAQAKPHQSIHLENAKQYIARHISKAFTIQELADHLAINKAYLMRLFRKYEDCTVTDYIHRERIKAAKNMLRFSDYSIEEIAHYLQFSSQSYFGSVFKKETGITPYQFRLRNMIPGDGV